MSDERRKTESELRNEAQQWPAFDWTEGTRSWEPDVIGELPESSVSQPEPAAAPAVEPPKPKRKRRKGPRTNAEALLGALIYVVGVLVVSFAIATVGWKWAGDLLALDKPEKIVTFTVGAEDSFGEVTEKLKAEGLIEYQALFKAFAAFTHKAQRVTAGTYELTTEMDYSALLNGISNHSFTRETVTITIPEGYTVEEIFQQLEDAGVCSKDDLTVAAETGTFEYDFIKGLKRKGIARLEGYLFPDTYEFYKGSDGEKVIRRMLDNFRVKFDDEMVKKAKEMGYTRDEIIIMASIIEKETTGADREYISSVIHNRLRNPNHDGIGGKLEMDSTVQYILEERKEILTDKELSIDSPYNTRLYPGLPVGPICNPGAASIIATLYPENTDYYYFMLGDDGADHFFQNSSSFLAFKNAQTGNRGE